MTVHRIRIDRSRTLAEEPGTGHNRWHPRIPPILQCDPGDEVVMGTRDALDSQIGPGSTAEQVTDADLSVVHPLTGPVHVRGAEPGDMLEVEILDVQAVGGFGYTIQVPGFGFLRDDFPEPHIVRWDLEDGWATSADLPGVRIRAAPFMGVMGVAPSEELLARVHAREQELGDAGGLVLPPDPDGATPGTDPIASDGLRTIPPRENGGNMDIKQMSCGTTVRFPVFVDGAMFSAGDAHFAQGDGEACGTAIEIASSFSFRVRLRKGEAADGNVSDVHFVTREALAPDSVSSNRSYYATTGICVDERGWQEAENVTLAARNALLNMIDHITRNYPFDRRQAYALCSVAVDLKVSQLVDAPNVLVTAFLPMDIFTGEGD